MILNTIISAIIAIFFLGNWSKENKKRARKASIFRTFIYFCLTIIAFFIFYKSYQVSTIINMVDLKALRGSSDSLDRSRDTVKSITIYNKFQGAKSYDNGLLTVANEHKKDSFYTKNGGVHVRIKVANDPKYPVKNRKNLIGDIRKSIEDEFNRDMSTVGPVYLLTYLSTNIPSYIPVYPEIELGYGWKHDKGFTTSNTIMNSRGAEGINYTLLGKRRGSNISELEGAKELFDNGIVVQEYLVTDTLKEKNDDVFMALSHSFANTIDILTAADLSQYTFVLLLNSEINIKKLFIEYNLPIEVSEISDGMSVTFNRLDFDEAYLKANRGDAIMFHVKLPTMANIQLIRSLILTAILSALFTLSCKNLYYLLYRGALNYHKENKLKYSVLRRISRKRLKIFLRYLYCIALAFILLLFYMTYCVVNNKTFLVDLYYIEYRVIGIILVTLVVLSVMTYYLYKYAITPVPKKHGKEKMKEKDEKRKIEVMANKKTKKKV